MPRGSNKAGIRNGNAHGTRGEEVGYDFRMNSNFGGYGFDEQKEEVG